MIEEVAIMPALSYCIDNMITAVKQKITVAFTAFALLVGFASLAIPTAAYALNSSCGVDTTILACPNTVNPDSGKVEESGLWGILLVAIGILTAGVGVAALAGIVYGIILYTTSSGDPGGVKKALEIIRNVVIGVVAYALMWSLLNWLVPGGVFD